MKTIPPIIAAVLACFVGIAQAEEAGLTAFWTYDGPILQGTHPAPISFCDDMRGHRWVEYGTACHVDSSQRRMAWCGLEDGAGNVVTPADGSAGVCSVPPGFGDADWGPFTQRGKTATTKDAK